jgi:hypothetical protein
MHTLFQDLRYALRTLRKNMMLTLVIVASPSESAPILPSSA